MYPNSPPVAHVPKVAFLIRRVCPTVCLAPLVKWSPSLLPFHVLTAKWVKWQVYLGSGWSFPVCNHPFATSFDCLFALLVNVLRVRLATT
jgi:hypothetical protein